MAEFCPPLQGENQTKSTEKEPILVQLDPKCLHSALKEYLEPLRTQDSRTDFFAVYRKEAAEFDKDYVQKYDEDLNTTLIFAGLFSAVNSAFVIDIQSKLEPDPNDMTAAYMKILINAVNGSLFPDADPGDVAWTGPPPGIVTVQGLLYASLATSLFAVFVAALGKQWVNRYIRNHGGSAADKSRDRQRKLDGFEKWHFHLVIESLPIMLQLAVLLFGCALSRYLWTISRPIAGIILAITLLGAAIYIFLTLAATIHYNCPYQTPPSVIARAVIGYLSHNNSTFTRPLRSLVTPLPSIANLRTFLTRLRSGVRRVARVFGCGPVETAGTEQIPLAAVTEPPARIFKDVVVDWEECKADARCVSWVLESITDMDVILSTVRFAADMIWYPEIAGALSPHTLANLFFDCLLDGKIIPGKSEHATSIGMALASVLSVHLSVEPESETLQALCQRLHDHVQLEPPPTGPGLMSSLVVKTLRFVATLSYDPQGEAIWAADDLFGSFPDQLSTTHKLWLTRVVLQTFWRYQHVARSVYWLRIPMIHRLFEMVMADDGRSVAILRTNCFLIAAISLGPQIDFRDLHAPNDTDALRTAVHLFDQHFQTFIKRGDYYLRYLLLAMTHLDPLKVVGTQEMAFLWISEILNSEYPEEEQYLMACELVRLVEQYGDHHPDSNHLQSAWVPPLLKFLSLCENFEFEESPPHPALIALDILSRCPRVSDFCAAHLTTLISLLSPNHRLQSRKLALEVFRRLTYEWRSRMETVPGHHLDELLQAVGDPFHLPPESPHDQVRELEGRVNYEPMYVVVTLIGFALSELWQSHLRPSNFTSCEDILSTDEGRSSALRKMFWTWIDWREFLCTPTKIITAVRRLEELGCLNTARVVIMWAWVTGMADVMDQDDGRLIADETLRFYRAHGIRSLATLRRCTTDEGHEWYRNIFVPDTRPQFRARRRPPNITDRKLYQRQPETDRVITQGYQLRKFYRLLGYDPMTWREAVGVGEADEKREVISGHSVTPDPFVGWECDYP